ncbi:transcriptional repressor LexA [Acetonema longum]|uniref:LexA repressor n=1 Tax=Acetonema longum DSM 6540 TaxID=1009370 RepID=F7NEL3_9FIRM|nr:transcriptional repressor LexA [Acetonema longum]EGO65424.1 transcriptional repressor, LexA family protein [Acetonema longum DSM 6540]
MTSQALTDKQEQILAYIKENLRAKGYPPSVREIGKAVGLSSSSTVHAYLEKLEAQGYIRRDPTKPRAIDMLDETPWRQKDMVPVPVVGRVTAGQPVLAVENIEETYPLPAELIGRNDNVFMLTVSGDSMINAGIFNGDYILVQETHSAENGDIVVALIDGEEATVKRFFKEASRIRLQPENDAMAPLYPEHVEIIGRVVGLFRQI